MQVLISHSAAKYIERLDAPTKQRIKTALDELAKEPPQGDITPIQGQESAFRVRVGSYRLLCKQKLDCIVVYAIDPRGQAYKKKNMKGR
jgi:mRNA interferase RelE/StbE